MDRIIEEGCYMLVPIQMILEETILEKCKIIEVKILEVDIEVIIEMASFEEVDVGHGKDNIHIILEGIIEAVAVGQDLV